MLNDVIESLELCVNTHRCPELSASMVPGKRDHVNATHRLVATEICGSPTLKMTTTLQGSLASFMSNARNTLQSAIINQQQVTIVLSSDSADLDSIASTIVLAYIRSSAPSNTPLTNQSVNRHQPTYQYPPLYIPVINALLRDIRDRPDILVMLQHANLQLEHLITLDDLETEPPAGLNPDNTSRLQPRLTRLILMSRIKLVGRLSQEYTDCVVGYIINNDDTADVSKPTGSDPRIAIEAGGCSSLVINHYQNSWNELSTSGSTSAVGSAQDDAAIGFDDTRMRQTWDAQVAKLALAGVLTNTKNLMDQGQTTKQDVMACEYLEAKISLSDVSWNRNTFFESLK